MRSTHKGRHPIPPYGASNPLDRGVKSSPRRAKLGVRLTGPPFRPLPGVAPASPTPNAARVRTPNPQRQWALRGAQIFKPRSTLSDDRDVTLIRRSSAVAGARAERAVTAASWGAMCAPAGLRAPASRRVPGSAVR